MKTLRITVSGQVFEVGVEVLDEGQPAVRPRPAGRRGGANVGEAPAAVPATPKGPAASGAVPSPLAGTVVSITVKPGQEVKSGDNLVVLEAMKMNTFVNATADGTVKEILVKPGDAVEEGEGLLVMG
jgi:biotin carboxyl carrier protein